MREYVVYVFYDIFRKSFVISKFIRRCVNADWTGFFSFIFYFFQKIKIFLILAYLCLRFHFWSIVFFSNFYFLNFKAFFLKVADAISTPIVGIASDKSFIPFFMLRLGRRISWHIIGFSYTFYIFLYFLYFILYYIFFCIFILRYFLLKNY